MNLDKMCMHTMVEWLINVIKINYLWIFIENPNWIERASTSHNDKDTYIKF